jgi:hypothetical protein
MKVRTFISVLLFFAAGSTKLLSQTYNQPEIGLKSHETLEILKVEVTSEKTVVYLTIENRIAGGNFCADRNIYLIEPDGEKLKLKKASGIPACPDTYKFKKIGEKLPFTLEFPALKTGIKWIDIIEDCNNNCFSLYGITLNPLISTKMNEAFLQVEKGEKKEALAAFVDVLSILSVSDRGIEGAIYTDIISLSIETGDKAGAGEWYKKMLSANVPRLELYVKNLNSRGIKF